MNDRVSSVDIRAGTEADLPFARALGLRTNAANVPSIRGVVDPARVDRAFLTMLDLVCARDHAVLVAWDNGRPVGYALCTFDVPDEVTLSPQTYVFSMAVEPADQRRGIGRALLAAVEAASRDRGLRYVSLTVTESNVPGANFFAQAGYARERVSFTRAVEAGAAPYPVSAMRAARPEDLTFIADLGARTAHTSASPLRSDANVALAKQTFINLMDLLKRSDHEIVVVEHEQTPIGFSIGVYDVPDEIAGLAQIYAVYSALEVEGRGRGIGSDFLRHWCNRAVARGVGFVTCMQTVGNEGAHGTARRLHFSVERVQMMKIV